VLITGREVAQRSNDEASTGRHRISRSRPSIPSPLPVYDRTARPEAIKALPGEAGLHDRLSIPTRYPATTLGSSHSLEARSPIVVLKSDVPTAVVSAGLIVEVSDGGWRDDRDRSA
jgi:hypothetical protein